MRTGSHTGQPVNVPQIGRKDPSMEHNRNADDIVRDSMPHKVRHLCGFLAVMMGVLLFFVVPFKLGILHAKDISGFIRDLDRLASVFLKAAVAYFFIQAAGMLPFMRKGWQSRSPEKRSGKRQTTLSTPPEPDEKRPEAVPKKPEPASKDMQVAKGGSRLSEQSEFPFESRSLAIDMPREKESSASRDELSPVPVEKREYTESPKMQFDFKDRKSSLNNVDCKNTGLVCLMQVDEGDLEGTEVESNIFYVWPKKEYLTESDLRYSAVTACFRVNPLSRPGKRIQVRCDKPAVLCKTGINSYELIEKGALTEISIVE